ncbi:hypothetical protein JOM56_009804 [Amanita muscaria]
MKLRKHEMDAEEWEIADQLSKVLKIFKDATLYFSRDGVPNIAMVIPAMDHLDEALATNTINANISDPIQAALLIGKKTLNHYYSKTDLSGVYRIAMILHPRHKLAYFKQARWEDEWIKTAHELIRDTYYKSYFNCNNDSGNDNVSN